MTLARATWLQTWVGRMGALFCVLFVIAALDGLISRFRQPVNQLDLRAGEVAGVNGGLPVEIKEPGELAFDSDSPGIRIVFEAVHSGFWLGGNMWRGVLEVEPSTPAGGYTAVVRLKDRPDEKPLVVLVVQVHDTLESIRKSSTSFFRRSLDLAPWMVFVVFFLLAGLAFGVVYVLTGERDRLLAEQGRAELYRVAKRDDFYEVGFGLGRKHGVEPGEELPLESRKGEVVGTVRVRDVLDEDSIGEVDLECAVRPDCVVSKPGARKTW